MSRTLALLTTVVLSLSLIALVACGGGGEEEGAETPAGATATTAAQTTPTEAGATASPSDAGAEASPTVPPPVTVGVSKSFWHGGWKVTLVEATFATTIDDWGIRTTGVSIEATFENLGDDDDVFNSHLVLAAGGKNYAEPTSDQEIPEVPGKLLQTGKITFAVDPEFEFDDAVLIVGRPENNQATIPLGPAGGDFVSLEPREVSVAGQASSGRITISLNGGDLRADIPADHGEMKKGWLALTLRFSASMAQGNYVDANVMYDYFALTLPDGTSVAADDGPIESISQGTTLPDLFLRFGVRDPAQGAYTLRFKDPYGEYGEVQFQIQ